MYAHAKRSHTPILNYVLRLSMYSYTVLGGSQRVRLWNSTTIATAPLLHSPSVAWIVFLAFLVVTLYKLGLAFGRRWDRHVSEWEVYFSDKIKLIRRLGYGNYIKLYEQLLL